MEGRLSAVANILFDLDGTLVDSLPALARVGNALNKHLGRGLVGEAEYAGFVGHGTETQVRRLLEHCGGVPDVGFEPCLDWFRAAHEEDPVTGATVYPGVIEALDRLREDGHALAVVTQKDQEPARRALGGLGLSDRFEWLTAGGLLPVLKPDPAMITETLRHMPDGAAMFVGDSHVDAACAANAGIPFLLHEGGYPAGSDPVPCLAAFTDWAALPALVAACPAVRPMSQSLAAPGTLS